MEGAKFQPVFLNRSIFVNVTFSSSLASGKRNGSDFEYSCMYIVLSNYFESPGIVFHTIVKPLLLFVLHHFSVKALSAISFVVMQYILWIFTRECLIFKYIDLHFISGNFSKVSNSNKSKITYIINDVIKFFAYGTFVGPFLYFLEIISLSYYLNNICSNHKNTKIFVK